jgi:hypothetical protein
MTVFASLFDGKAEVICGERAGESQPLASPAVTDGDILALLSRRPGTAQGVSAGLGLHIAEATKRLQSPLEQEHLSTLRRNNTLFYRTKPAT